MSGADFFRGLPICTDFTAISDPGHYRPVPPDWQVVITDVRSSTEAIAAGRYKDVNLVGAAAIAAIQNAHGGMELPYVFGGDGATVLAPPESLPAIAQALAGLQALARTQFQLDLRTGAVPVAAVLAAGSHIEAGRYPLTTGRCIAVFRGGGLALADRWLKADEARWRLPTPSGLAEADLNGLSCRWQAIPSRRGRVLSLLVLARGEAPAAVYGRVLRALERIFAGRLEEGNPIHPARMRYRSLRACLVDELRAQRGAGPLVLCRRILETVVAVAIFRLGLPGLVFDARRYAGSMRSHADHRKFDDMLRMVLDCTPAQADRIRLLLESGRRQEELFYGLHDSNTALMTCFVQRPVDGGHIHFIDGGDGGYAIAARQLKAQMASVGRRP
jgi:hypothetical protein